MQLIKWPVLVWSGILFVVGSAFWIERTSAAETVRTAAQAEAVQQQVETAQRDAIESRRTLSAQLVGAQLVAPYISRGLSVAGAGRFGCDCRALAMTQLIAADEMFTKSLAGNSNAYVSMQVSDHGAVGSTLLDHLGAGIDEALGTLFESCPAALAFPVYIVAPNDLSGDEIVDHVRQCRSTLGSMCDGRGGKNADMPDSGGGVCFLPQRDNAADGVIGIFESQPDLPGAVVLAFDSPFWRSHHSSPCEEVGLEVGGETVLPAQGVVALVVTHPDLAEMLKALPSDDVSSQLMAPHREKSANRRSKPAGFSGLSAVDLASLARTRPLARIHRAASASIKSGGSRRQELAQCLELLIGHAQISSAQVDIAFSASVEVDEERTALTNGRSECGWLVHNAGGATVGGQRLASLGSALITRGLDVEPIDEATDVSQAIGDLGCARELAALALTVVHAAIAGRNVLCADFGGDDRISVFFAAVSPESA